MTTYGPVYKKTATGAIQQWSIYVVGDSYTTTYGQVGGSPTISAATVCKPKNEGQANATTAEEQALKKAKSLWQMKLKDGYTKTIEAAQAGLTDALVGGGIEPMLAIVYWKRTGKLKPQFPADAQPKLDGMRCIAHIDDEGHVRLWSRERRPIVSVPHIAIHLEGKAERLGRNVFVDGELYLHTNRAKFRDLMSMARKNTATAESATLEYHVYDFFDPAAPDESFAARSAHLAEALAGEFPVRLVKTSRVDSEQKLLDFYQQCLADGYEGAMYRNPKAPYEGGKRSANLLKVKPEDDHEYEILDVIPGEGGAAEHGVFVCRSPANATDPTGKLPPGTPLTFTVLMACTHEERKELLTNRANYIGKQLTVTHQGFTDYGQPRCPRAKAVRE
jgi:ATP-dependent DNA ligase